MVFKKEELNKFLYKASEKGDVKKVKALIKKKADVNAKIFRDRTPLHIAAVSGHAELAKLLIKKNA